MNRLFSSIRNQVLTISILQAFGIAVLLFSLYYWNVQHQAYEESVNKARNVVSVAEAVRGDMAKKWDMGIFSAKQMKQWADEGKIDHVLSAVPIVAAWKSVENGMEGKQLTVKVPKFKPRNSANQPDDIESDVLKAFESDATLKEKVVLDSKANTVRYFRPIRLTHDCMLCHGDPKTSQELWGNDRGIDGTGNLMENWKVGEVHGAFEIVQRLDESQAAANYSVAKGLGCYTFLVAGTLFIFAWVISRNVTNPISSCVEALKKLAQGDLTTHIASGAQGEVGTLQAGMISMRDRLRGMLSKLDHYSNDLQSASNDLHHSAEQLSENSSATQQTTSMVSAAAEEMSINVNQMSQASNTISDNINSVSAAVNQLRTASKEVELNVRDTNQVSEEAVQIAQQGGRMFSQLHDAAKQIGSVSDLIQDIAEQTNLLALNATIEAARAGTAGQGFAVVASEVKSLAKQTALATEDIRNRIDGMQEASISASNSIQEIERVIGTIHRRSVSIVDTLEQQNSATTSISTCVDRTLTEIAAFANNSRESAIATREVAQCFAKVENGTREAAANATQTREQGARLQVIAGEVKRMLGEFRI